MAVFKINDDIWGGLSDGHKAEIIDHLKVRGVMKASDTVEGVSSVPAPTNDALIFGATFGDIIGLVATPEGMCKAACDAIAASAVSSCTATGPLLQACLAIIAVAREKCRQECS